MAARSIRERLELEKTYKTLDTQQSFVFSLLEHEKKQVQGTLLDIQSKTKNLSDTISAITSQLLDEKEQAEKNLEEMTEEAKEGNAAAFDPLREKELQDVVLHHKAKLEWIDPAKYGPQIKKHMDVIDMVRSKKGFFGKLDKIRAAKKADEVEKEEKPETPPLLPPTSPTRDICSLIDHFLKLPKIYPAKPRKQKPKASTVMMEVYAERRRHREASMSYGTRRRIRLTENHCDSLKEIYLSTSSRPKSFML